MKTIISGWTLIFVFLIVDIVSADITFPDDVAGRMIVEIEQCRIDTEITTLQDKAVENLKTQAGMKDRQLEACNRTLKDKDGLLDKQAREYEAAMKAQKLEHFFDGIMDFISGALVGVGITAAYIFLH
jgi:hypothetical protein